MGFDGGVWYGQGNFDDKKDAELFYLEAKYRQRNGFGKPGFGSVTGYFLKKLVHYQNVIGTGKSYSINNYLYPIMRLAELFQLYTEALNVSQGTVTSVNKYVNLLQHGRESV